MTAQNNGHLDRMGPATRAVHAGRADLTELGVHALPLDFSTTNPLPNVTSGGDSYETLATGGVIDDACTAVYQRLWNPTVARFEAALATLEQTPHAVAFSTGMAAFTATLMALRETNPAPHLVAVRPVYGGSDHLLATGLLGTTTTFCAHHELSTALQPSTDLVFLETPANPSLELIDLEQTVDLIRQRSPHALVLVDNTFATPVLQKPCAWGVDLVLHSATKYLGGHGDAMGGIVACGGERAEETAAVLRRIRAITGGILHPMAAYLLHRGLPTLPVRMYQQSQNAHDLAYALSELGGVQEVHYPDLPHQDPHKLIGGQMACGGAMVAFRLVGGFDHAAHTVEHTRLITHAVSLGGVDSLIQHPASLTHRPVQGTAKPGADLVRLSVGLEDPADLIADLSQAIGSFAG